MLPTEAKILSFIPMLIFHFFQNKIIEMVPFLPFKVFRAPKSNMGPKPKNEENGYLDV